MDHILPRDALARAGIAELFQGREHGGIAVSFFLVRAARGDGPRLHAHPYGEVFVVQSGRALFTVGDATHEVGGGAIVLAPADTPHTFTNPGAAPLQMIAIHPSPEVITRWLEA